MPFTRLRRRHKSARPINSRRPALTLETLEDRALMSATMIQEIVPQNPLANADNLTDVNGTLFFTVNDGPKMAELWKTDGTPAGTVHLHDFALTPGFGSVGPNFLTAVNGSLYFAVNSSADAGLWKSDGTTAGTAQVAPFRYLDHLIDFNNTLYFSGVATMSGPAQVRSVGATSGPALWKSDGTAAGTVDVQDVAIYSPLTAVNGSLYFDGADLGHAHGAELWKSDGTHAGTAMLKEIAPGPVSSSPYDLAAAHNTLFFEIASPLGQSGLWASDGTPGGTTRLQQAVPYGTADMVNVNGTLYFLNAGPTNPGIWKTDGTPGGTSLVTPISNDADATVSMTAFQGALYYLRQSTPGGPGELWKTDGTAIGTMNVTTLPPTGSPPGSLLNVNGTLYFTASDGAGGLEVWKSDGTAAGTVMIEDVAHAGAGRLANVQGKLFFAVNDGQGIQVWKNDPASGPTAVAGGPYSLTAGESVKLDGHASTGTGPLIYGWTINGHALPGSPGQATLTLNWAALMSYGITGPGSYAVTLGVTDGQGTSTSSATLTVRSPLLNITSIPVSATEGVAFSGPLAKFKDPAGAKPASTYNAQVDWGDGTAPAIVAVTATSKGFVISGAHTYAEEGSYKITVNVEKGGGLPNTVTQTVKVGDAPVWAGRQFLRTTEGQSWTGSVATITDASPLAKASDFTATIQWGDGTTSAGKVVATGPGKFAVQGGHTYAMAGTYSVTVAIADVGGVTSTTKSTFLVDDAALMPVPQKLWPNVRPASAAPAPTMVAAFTDANPLATATQFTATIDWGDGTTSAGTVAHAVNQPMFVVTGGHAYTKSGSYKVTTTILDAGGSSLKTKTTVQVSVPTPVPLGPGQGGGKGNN
jgi:ELWxxDGT repeat protein